MEIAKNMTLPDRKSLFKISHDLEFIERLMCLGAKFGSSALALILMTLATDSWKYLMSDQIDGQNTL
jgi:hypothetical protein